MKNVVYLSVSVSGSSIVKLSYIYCTVLKTILELVVERNYSNLLVEMLMDRRTDMLN